MQAQLKRHVIRKHQSHEQVRAAMQLPKAEQARAFDGIKKRGIYLENVKRIDKSEKLLSLNGTKGIGRAKFFARAVKAFTQKEELKGTKNSSARGQPTSVLKQSISKRSQLLFFINFIS